MNYKFKTTASVIFLIISIAALWQAYNIYRNFTDVTEKGIKEQNALLESSQNILKRANDFIKFASDNKKIIDKFDLILPVNEDKDNLLSILESMARLNGLNLLGITFENIANSDSKQPAAAATTTATKTEPDFKSMNINLSLDGSYVSLKNFLAEVEKNSRMLDVVSVNFSGGGLPSADGAAGAAGGAGDGKKAYSYSIVMKTYFYAPIGEQNIALFLNSEKFKVFSLENLNFTGEKAFTNLNLPENYYIDIQKDEIGNPNIF